MYAKTRSIIVNDIMSYPVVTATDKESIKSVANKMQKYRIGAVVVVNKHNEPRGIVTQGDIVRRLVTKKRYTIFLSRASHIMSSPVVTATQGMRIEEAARLMANSKIKRLCVVDNENQLIGILTSNDIARNEGHLIEILNEMIDTGYTKEPEEVYEEIVVENRSHPTSILSSG